MNVEDNGRRQQCCCIEIEIHRAQLLQRGTTTLNLIGLVNVRLDVLHVCSIPIFKPDVRENQVCTPGQRAQGWEKPYCVRQAIVGSKHTRSPTLCDPFALTRSGRGIANLSPCSTWQRNIHPTLTLPQCLEGGRTSFGVRAGSPGRIACQSHVANGYASRERSHGLRSERKRLRIAGRLILCRR